MERYSQLLSPDVSTWAAVVSTERKPSFRLATLLGSGENSDVYATGPRDADAWYSDGSQGSTSSSSGGDSSSSSSSEEEGGEEEEKDEDADEKMRRQGVDVSRVRMLAADGSQVVAKVFSHLDEDTCYGVFCGGDIVKVVATELDGEDYVRSTQLQGGEVRELQASNDGSFSAFVTESLCHVLLSQLPLTPHVATAYEALTYKNTGFLLLERLWCTLDDLIYDACSGAKNRLTPVALRGLLFQTLFAVATLQRACGFKHHDLHSNNVFIKKVDEKTTFRGCSVHGTESLHYHLDGVDYYIPNNGYLAKLADFGMTSIDVHGTRLRRADMDTFNDNPTKWGLWSSSLNGEEGYDTQFLSADILQTCESAHKKKKKNKNKKLTKELAPLMALFNAFSEAAGAEFVTLKKKRPLPGCVSRKDAARLIRELFAAEALPSPPASCVTLGDSRW